MNNRKQDNVGTRSAVEIARAIIAEKVVASRRFPPFDPEAGETFQYSQIEFCEVDRAMERAIINFEASLDDVRLENELVRVESRAVALQRRHFTESIAVFRDKLALVNAEVGLQWSLFRSVE